MQCECFEVSVGLGGEHALDQYVVDFDKSPPASGLTLRGSLVRQKGALLFQVSRAEGPWSDRMPAMPVLREIRLRTDATLESNALAADCRGLSLAGPDALKDPLSPRVSLATNSASAFDWTRFHGRSAWARHIIHVVRSAGMGDAAARLGRPAPLFVDIGAGCGWMAALVKAHAPALDVLSTDISEGALQLVRANARRNGLEVQAEQGDLWEPCQRSGRPRPSFAFFFPPQDVAAEGVWMGGPGVSLFVPDADKIHFHSRFCREAELADGGVAWLGVNWALLDAVVESCCRQGWDVRLPPSLRDVTYDPTALLELRRRADWGERKAWPWSWLDAQADGASVQCIEQALQDARGAAEYQIRGLGARDDKERFQRLRTAAHRNLAEGRNNLAMAYEEGRGVEPDEFLAGLWYRRAAKLGSESAQANFAQLLASRGVARHDASAASWCRQAAEHGHRRAQRDLSFMYQEGLGVPRSEGESLRWLQRAAAQGDAKAQASLGHAFATGGRGLRTNESTAAGWLRKAAHQGEPSAQTALAMLLMRSTTLPCEASEAEFWLKEAATLGQPEAQSLLRSARFGADAARAAAPRARSGRCSRSAAALTGCTLPRARC